MGKVATVLWADTVAKHDYSAAFDYLSLRWDRKRATATVRRLADAKLESRRANDLLRAARLAPAPLNDPGVMKDLLKVARHVPLSPVLCVALETGLEIADGYHRISLAYHLDPHTSVPLALA